MEDKFAKIILGVVLILFALGLKPAVYTAVETANFTGGAAFIATILGWVVGLIAVGVGIKMIVDAFKG